MNIAKGVVAQECLRRRLTAIGIKAPRQDKSHRTEDLYDFQIECGTKTLNIDLKTWVYYRDFQVAGRDPLTLEMIVDNLPVGSSRRGALEVRAASSIRISDKGAA